MPPVSLYHPVIITDYSNEKKCLTKTSGKIFLVAYISYLKESTRTCHQLGKRIRTHVSENTGLYMFTHIYL